MASELCLILAPFGPKGKLAQNGALIFTSSETSPSLYLSDLYKTT